MKAPIFLSLLLACSPVFAADKAAEKSATDELLAVMHYEDMAVDAAVAVFDGVMDQLKQNGVPAAAIGEIRVEARGLFTRIFANPEMRKQMKELYEKHFTESEILEMTEFYRTPLGQKTLSAMPAIMQDSTKMADPLVQKEMPAFQQKVAEIVEKHQKPAAPDKEGKDAKEDEEDAE
jgi:hypothetical protein